MTIFNIELFGTDAEWFCNLSKLQQTEWIKKNTNQSSDDLINEFLASPLKNKKEYCFTCRDKKQKVSIAKIIEDGNISKGNEQEVTATTGSTTSKKSRKYRDNK